MRLIKFSKLQNKLNKPLFFRQVVGDSMNPTLSNGKIVVCTSLLAPKNNQVIVFIHNSEKIKRIKSITKEKIFVVGDNLESSTDSREFGAINRSQVVGRVILPRI